MSFENISYLLEKGAYGELRDLLSGSNPVDIADYLTTLDPEKSLVIFRILPKAVSVDVFSYLTAERQQHIIESISDWEIRQIIDDLFIDDAVDFLEELPAMVVKKVLRNTDENTRTLINTFLQYPPESAGSIMTLEYVDLNEDLTVEEAIERIRRVGSDKETIYTSYVISTHRRLLGTLALRKLIIAEPDKKVVDIMNDNIIKVHTLDDREIVAENVKKYDLLSIPVVDNEDRLVGIITVDDIIDVIEEENTEDFEIMAGMTPSEKPYLSSGVFTLAKNRITWLMILMLSSSITQAIIGMYDEILSSVLILASFIPLLTDTGGNAGSQSATMIIRGLAVGEIALKDFAYVAWKEFRVSLLCGSALGIVNFVKIVFLNRASVVIAFVVSLSVLVTVVAAKVIGCLLPIAAKKLKLDPALMASPLITTIVDSIALVFYFLIASVFLRIG